MYDTRRLAAWIALAVVLVAALVILAALALSEEAGAEGIPAGPRPPPRLVRAAHYVFGLEAPVAVLAAQVHAESAWNPRARSPHAEGLAQFTPDTAAWMAETYPGELAGPAPFDPLWSLLALCRYDGRLYERMPGDAGCERWAFTLSAYNGGPGWIPRDRA